MKKILIAAIAAFALSTGACTSVDATKVDGATIASNGEAVGVIQASAIGFTLIFGFVKISDANLDLVVNKLLVTEAKALGASKVELLTAVQQPNNGLLWHLLHGLISFPVATTTGVAIR
jgi:hypothetical protein